jgi:hypothetical protein
MSFLFMIIILATDCKLLTVYKVHTKYQEFTSEPVPRVQVLSLKSVLVGKMFVFNPLCVYSLSDFIFFHCLLYCNWIYICKRIFSFCMTMFSTFSHLHCTITISSVLNSNVSVVNFIKYIKTFKYYVSDDKVLDKIIQKRFVKIIYLDYNKQCSQVRTLGCRFVGTYELSMAKAAKRTYNLSRFVL